MKRPVRRLISWLLYGGSYTLRDYESRILNFVRASLRPEDQSALDLQLDDLDHLKRAHQGRMVTFFYLSPKTVPKLSNDTPDNDLAWVSVTSSGISLRVRVTSHRGLFSSLEFSRSPTELKDKTLNLAFTRRRSKDPDLAEMIDREEHGPS